MKDVDEKKGQLEERLTEVRKAITESVASDAEWKRAREELSVVYDALNSSVNGVIITNLEGRITYVNPSFLRIFGYRDKAEVLGRNAADLFSGKEVKRFADVKAIIDETRGESEEFIAQGRDGTSFPVEVSSSSVTDSEGNIVGKMASFIDITERVRAVEALRKSEKRLRVLSAKLLEVQEQERQLIAQELHDSIGASLVAIKYSLEKKLDEMGEDSALGGTSIEAVISMVHNTIEETRRISTNLRPSILDDLGILATIRWFCREFQEVYLGIRIEKRVDIGEDEVSDQLKIVIYRVLQEAFNNVAKHSGADIVRLSLRKTEDTLELSIEDNGQGFDLEEVSDEEGHTGAMGLSSMKERTELSGGSFSIVSSKGKGTTIMASWPCD